VTVPARAATPPVPSARWREGWALALLAVAVRLAHLLLGRGDPAWGVPVVDADTYRTLAEHLAAGAAPTAALVWQPALYPVGLALLFKAVGPSVLAARLAQVLLGGATCLAGWRLAGRWFGPGPARTAGLLIALSGPLVFYEGLLLAAGPAALLATLLALAADRAGGSAKPGPALLTGALGAAAVLLRPTFLPAAAGLVLWLGLARTPGPGRSAAARRGLVALAAAVVLLAPVELAARARLGHGAILPTSGSLNLYLGNNPDRDRTLNIRPGLAWDALMAAPPDVPGEDRDTSGPRWYRAKVREFVRRHPGAFLAGLGAKTLHLLSSRELPRNQDVYLERRWSPVLKPLVWRLGRFGFPMGLLLPAAVFGLVSAGSRRTVPGLILLAGTGAALVLVFTAGRYRVPLVPLVAVFAAAGLHRLGRLRRPDRRTLAGAAAAAAVLLAGVVPGPFAQERGDFAGELEFAVGHALYARQDWPDAGTHLRRAADLLPDRAEPRNFLAIILARTGHPDEAVAVLESAVALAPDWQEARHNLAVARGTLAADLYRRARLEEGTDPVGARALCRRAAELDPDWAEPVARLAWYAATSRVDSLRDGDEAVRLARRAVGLGGAHPYLQLVLAAALARDGQAQAAVAAADSGLTLVNPRNDPDGRWARELTAARARFAAGGALQR